MQTEGAPHYALSSKQSSMCRRRGKPGLTRGGEKGREGWAGAGTWLFICRVWILKPGCTHIPCVHCKPSALCSFGNFLLELGQEGGIRISRNVQCLLVEHSRHGCLSVSHHQSQGFRRLLHEAQRPLNPFPRSLWFLLSLVLILSGSALSLLQETIAPDSWRARARPCGVSWALPAPAGLLSTLQRVSECCHLGHLDLKECLVAFMF